MSDATPLQRAVLDALGNQKFSADTLAFHMGISYSAVHGRLMSLWRKGLVDRGWSMGALVWWRVG